MYQDRNRRFKGVMKTTTQSRNSTVTEFGNAGQASIMTLDGSTRLRMATEQKPVRYVTAASGRMAPARVSIAKEAIGVSLLLGLFTGAFWLLITFIRSY